MAFTQIQASLTQAKKQPGYKAYNEIVNELCDHSVHRCNDVSLEKFLQLLEQATTQAATHAPKTKKKHKQMLSFCNGAQKILNISPVNANVSQENLLRLKNTAAKKVIEKASSVAAAQESLVTANYLEATFHLLNAKLHLNSQLTSQEKERLATAAACANDSFSNTELAHALNELNNKINAVQTNGSQSSAMDTTTEEKSTASSSSSGKRAAESSSSSASAHQSKRARPANASASDDMQIDEDEDDQVVENASSDTQAQFAVLARTFAMSQLQMQTELDQREQRLDEQEQTILSLQSQLAESKQSVTSHQQEIAQLSNQLSTAEAKVSAAESAYNTLITEHENSQQTILTLTAESERLKNELAQLTQTNSTLKQVSEKDESQLAALGTELSAVKSELKTTQVSCQREAGEAKGWRSVACEREEEIKRLMVASENNKARIKDLTSQLAGVKATLQGKQTDFYHSQQRSLGELRQAKAELDDARSELSQLRVANQSLKSELDSVKEAQVDAAGRNQPGLVAQIEHLLEAERARTQALSSALAEARDENERLKHTILLWQQHYATHPSSQQQDYRTDSHHQRQQSSLPQQSYSSGRQYSSGFFQQGDGQAYASHYRPGRK